MSLSEATLRKLSKDEIINLLLDSYILKRGTSWNHLEPAGTTWNELEPPRTSWNHLERGRITWNKTQKQEINRKELRVQHHCPTESNIGNIYSHKKHHLRCLQVKSPRTEWNQ